MNDPSDRNGTALGGQAARPLRLVTCGSQGGGKSQLVEALLAGVTGSASFSPDRCKVVVTDLPGHAQHTGDMLSRAATAYVALIVVDAREGLQAQARRHSHLMGLMGVRALVLVVNKMDLMDHAEQAFQRVCAAHRAFAAQMGLSVATAIPVSALQGANIVRPGAQMPWYRGPTLLNWLEVVAVAPSGQDGALRLPVQSVERATAGGCSIFGTLAGGQVSPGDRIRVQPSGRESTVTRVVSAAGELARAAAGEPVTLALADTIDIASGDLISSADSPAEVADQFEATLVWLSDTPMQPGRPYRLSIGACTAEATIAEPRYTVDVETAQRLAARTLQRDDIGVCHVALDRSVAFDAHPVNRETGGFVLTDSRTQQPVALGMLHGALRRADNIHLQPVDVDKAARSAIKGQRPVVVWLTGLSGAGKSTIANLVEKRLHAMGRHSYLLDGDNVRHGLNRDLGFTDADRVENIRRVAEVARLMVDAGLIVITAFISPFRAERALARSLVGPREFMEVHVDAALGVVESRDVKGLYKKARRGELKNFTGISSPYEAPEQPDLRIDTAACTAEQAAQRVIETMRALGLVA
jgi:bifunctional enzyme CysN/CysC